ncbi:hypothetical protein [Kitasatospora mediocidica]|uniref:hypothetical protein n=1 Tax=Kitasatospora mediocidica TaxID=58352 RepID=UPI00055AA5EB|nr:hypothetical protein [Kitasatospora mediocidica]
MNHTGSVQSVQKAAGQARGAIAEEVAVATRAVVQAGQPALDRLLPPVTSAASELGNDLGRAAEQTRRGYRRHVAPRLAALPHLTGPSAAQRSRTRRRRVTGLVSAGLLGLAGALTWQRLRSRQGATELDDASELAAWLGRADDRPSPCDAVAAVSDRGIAAAESLEEDTLTTGAVPPKSAELDG